MSPRSCVGRGWVFVAVVASVAAAGCRTGQWASGKPGPCPVDVAPPIVSRVMPGDTLHGHLYPDQGCQCFYFEGVEYGVLSVELKTDVGNQAAPYLAIYGPDDAPLPLGDGFGPEGSARKRADGIVLPRTGTYRATVCKAPCEPESYWSFSYDVAILSPGEQKMHLTASAPKSMTFVAPRGARCMVRVSPDAGSSGLVPRIKAVKDPEGGRALDEASRPENAVEPTLNRGTDGSVTLDFVAPRSGRYVLEVSAEEGTEGDATTAVSVIPAKRLNRDLHHDNKACPERMVTPPVPKAG